MFSPNINYDMNVKNDRISLLSNIFEESILKIDIN
jgi:hypothetical protein